jgi:D-beta-D-heptose 7-phosphate kinase / D-beta-D-heptose 1-phosphate adenosyltransferase
MSSRTESMHKLKTLESLARTVTSLRRKHRTIVFTNGCFDVLHAGHLRSLQQAKRQGDVLIVGLNSDASVRRLKGRYRPIFRERDRASLLCALEVVDYCVIFSAPTPEKVIRRLKPDVLVKGADYRHRKVVGEDTVRAAGGRVVLVKLMKGQSTSAAIKKIRQLPDAT